MKKLIIIIILIKCSLAFSQEFNDKLITTTGDTIRCQVTSVNNDNVFYAVKIKNDFSIESLSIVYVKKLIIDKENKPQILLTGKRDTLITTGVDDTLAKSKKLIVEQTKLREGNKWPRHITFIAGKRIVIKKYHDKKIIRGPLEYVTDSSILVKGKFIKIKEIQSVQRHSGGTLLVVGLSTSASFIIIAEGVNVLTVPKYDKYGDITNDPTNIIITIFVIGVLDLFTVVPAGIVQLALTKNYRMDKNWKIVISK